jgi:hypothetical protein
MVSAVKELMVSQSLSTTFSRVEKASFLKPRFLISFQTCSALKDSFPVCKQVKRKIEYYQGLSISLLYARKLYLFQEV